MARTKLNQRTANRVAVPMGATGGRTPPSKMTVALLVTCILAAVWAAAMLTPYGRMAYVYIFAYAEFYMGVLTLVSLSVTVMIGLVATDRLVLSIRQRVLLQSAHRTTGMIAVVSLGLHVATKLSIGHIALIDVFVPFLAPANTLWTGFGTLAGLMLVSVVWTGVARARFAGRGKPWMWRSLHSVAYLSWPVALVHGLSAGRQAATWVVVSYIVCVLFVLVALAVRLSVSLNRKKDFSSTSTGSLKPVGAAAAASAPVRSKRRRRFEEAPTVQVAAWRPAVAVAAVPPVPAAPVPGSPVSDSPVSDAPVLAGASLAGPARRSAPADDPRFDDRGQRAAAGRYLDEPGYDTPRDDVHDEPRRRESRFAGQRREDDRYDDPRRDAQHGDAGHESRRAGSRRVDQRVSRSRGEDNARRDDARYDDARYDDAGYSDTRHDEARYDEARYDEDRYGSGRYGERQVSGRRPADRDADRRATAWDAGRPAMDRDAGRRPAVRDERPVGDRYDQRRFPPSVRRAIESVPASRRPEPGPDTHRPDTHRPDMHRRDMHRADTHRPAPDAIVAAESASRGRRRAAREADEQFGSRRPDDHRTGAADRAARTWASDDRPKERAGRSGRPADSVRRPADDFGRPADNFGRPADNFGRPADHRSLGAGRDDRSWDDAAPARSSDDASRRRHDRPAPTAEPPTAPARGRARPADAGRHSRAEFVDLADPNYLEPDDTPTLVDMAVRRERRAERGDEGRRGGRAGRRGRAAAAAPELTDEAYWRQLRGEAQ